MMSVMPVEGTSTLDLNLGHSLRDLKEMKKNLKYDIAFWYCGKDVADSTINPVEIINKIQKVKGYKIWYAKEPKREKMDKFTSALKDSKLVILAISDNFAADEICMQVYELVKKIIKSDYLIIEFGKQGSHQWMQNVSLAAICTDVRVIMQDEKRLEVKLTEAIESIERHIIDVKEDKQLTDSPPDVFISYCWKNSHDAVAKGTKHGETSLGWLDPRKLVEFFKKHGKFMLKFLLTNAHKINCLLF